MPKVPKDMLHIATLEGLSQDQYEQVEKLLEEWKAEVMQAVKAHPAKGYDLGVAQIEAFVKLLGNVRAVQGVPPTTPGESPSSARAQYWAERYAYNEIDTALNEYIGRIRDEVLYGLRGGLNPTLVASRLYKATKDQEINWRRLARTEMIRAQSAGRIAACEAMGYDRVWCPPHAGACKNCRELLENRDFPIDQVRDATNFGRKMRDWIPCIPLHPHCRHAWLPYEPAVVEEARRFYAQMEQAGFTDDDQLDAMFDESGQLKPRYAGRDFSMFKTVADSMQDLHSLRTVDPRGIVLAAVIEKHRTEPGEDKNLPIDSLRVAEWDRELDPQKVARFADAMRAGATFPPCKVSQREDGTRWLLGGKHRAAARQLLGETKTPCELYKGLTWEQEQAINAADNGGPNGGPARVGKHWADGDLPDREPEAGVMYHVSPARNRSSILKHGLQAQEGGIAEAVNTAPDQPRGNYLFGSLGDAHHYANHEDAGAARHRLDLYRVRSEGINLNHDPQTGAHYVTEGIPADGVELLERAGGDVAKGYFDPPQVGLDPLLWDGTHLRREVRTRLTGWARRVLGPHSDQWARLYLTGGATSLQWAAVREPEPDPDVDLQIVVDYPKLRQARKEWRDLSEPDLHFALVALVRAALADPTEAAPGLRIDAFVRPELTQEQFERDARQSGQAVYDVRDRRWVHTVSHLSVERYGQPWLEGIGADVAEHNPGWVTDAEQIVALLERLLRAYEANPGPGALAELREAYRLLHDERMEAYAAAGEAGVLDHVADEIPNHMDGEVASYEARGNFIWQYAVAFGPLMQIKHLLHETELGKVWPGATLGIVVAKSGTPLFPRGGLKMIHKGQLFPHSDWESAAKQLAAHHQAGHTDVRVKAFPHPHAATERDLLPHEHKHLIGLAARHIQGGEFGKGYDEDSSLPDVLKMSPVSPNRGVEHWITVHPHGPEEPGQPVLVRNNADGSMTVIGGAGGSLNYLRLDPKRRVDRKDTAGAGEKKPDIEQPVSEEEQRRQEAEFEQHRQEHQAIIERTDEQKKDLQKRIDDYIGENLIDPELYRDGEIHERIVHPDGSVEYQPLGSAAKAKLMKRLRASSLHTLAYGQLALADTQAGQINLTRKVGDFEGLTGDGEDESEVEADQKPDGEETTPELENAEVDPLGEEAKARKQTVRLTPLTTEQAESLMELQTQLARVKRIQSKSRKVLRGQGTPSSALGLEWTDPDVGEVKQAVKEQVRQQLRTDAARDLLQTAEKHTYRKTRDRAFQQGAFDTIDAFSSAVLGSSAVSAETARLLGPAGAAQLVVHGIRQEAARDGVKLNLQKVYDSLEQLTQRHEQEVAGRALARARKSADTAVLAREERKLAEAGESLGTTTMWRSFEQQKMNDAAKSLGMAIGGFEAASALKVALDNPTPKIKVGGFESASRIKDLAQRAGIKITNADIKKVGSGDYSLTVEPERLEHLFDVQAAPNAKRREDLRKIRTGEDMQQAIAAAQHTPGMSDELAPAQAQGKLFLLGAGAATAPGAARHWNLTGTPVEKSIEDLRALKALGPTLAFAPGVGKTHTGIAAAMQLMHDEPDRGHRALVVAPTTALATWANTVSKQGGGHSVQIIGANYEYDPVAGNKTASGPKVSTKKKGAQYDTPADFNVISFETLAKEPDLAKKLGASIIITDEAQKAKNAKAGNWRGLKEVGDAAGVPRPQVESKTAFKERYGQLGQQEHITREDKIRQFREGLDEHLFQLSADAANNNLPGVTQGNDGNYQRHKVELDPEHLEAMKHVAQGLDQWRADYKAGLVPNAPAFGGRAQLQAALYDRPHNAMARKVGDIVDSLEPIHWDGFKGHPDHADGEGAGDYEQKAIVFSQFVKQLDHVKGELEDRGHKVFFAHGQLGHDQNDKVLKDYLAYKGKAVLVTSDKNATARSLQFGDNSGKFQHGSTQLIHYSRPDNNATIEQREARQHRRGAQVPVTQHIIDAGTPAEMRQEDRLESEKRTQELAGTSEQLVAGSETLRHILARKGQKPVSAQVPA